jgi:hypothetical protein
VESAEGEFVLVDLAPGTYDLAVDSAAGSGRSQGIQVVVSRRTGPITITLDPPARISGRVVDTKTGEGVEGASIVLDQRGGVSHRTRSDPSGNFALPSLPPGRRSLRVRKRGYVTRLLAGIDVVSGEERTVEVRVVPLGPEEKPKVEYFGIGAVLSSTPEGTLKILEAMEGSPSARLGLQRGDEILRIDGQETSALGLNRAIDLIRGEDGTSVTLEVKRSGQPYPVEMRVDRGRVVYDSGSSRR